MVKNLFHLHKKKLQLDKELAEKITMIKVIKSNNFLYQNLKKILIINKERF